MPVVCVRLWQLLPRIAGLGYRPEGAVVQQRKQFEQLVADLLGAPQLLGERQQGMC